MFYICLVKKIIPWDQRDTLFSLPQTNIKTPSLLVDAIGKGKWGGYLFGRLMSNHQNFEDWELNLKTHGSPR